MTALALSPADTLEIYEAPSLELVAYDDIHEEHAIWWAIVVGFSFAVAASYAAYCTSKGGSPDISFGWGGFKVRCYR